MPGKGRFAKTAVTYAVKYGPLVYEAVKHGREPAQRAVQKALDRRADRRRAIAHATTVVAGSVLRVFHRAEPVWVVFSAETPVASYPDVDAPLPSLLEHADLSLRVSPSDLRSRRRTYVTKLPKLSRRVVLSKLPLPRRSANRRDADEDA